MAFEVPSLVAGPPEPPVATAPQAPAPGIAELAPIVDLLAHAHTPTPVGGVTPLLVDVLLSFPAFQTPVPELVPAQLSEAASGLVAASGFGEALATEPPPSPVVEDRIEPGDTLLGALARHGVTASTVAVIVRELKPHFDFRRARPGHRYRLERGEDGALLSFRYDVSAHEHYEVVRQGEGFEARGAKRGMVRQQARLAGSWRPRCTTRSRTSASARSWPPASPASSRGTWTSRRAAGPATSSTCSTSAATWRARTGAGSATSAPGRILAARYQSARRRATRRSTTSRAGRAALLPADGSPCSRPVPGRRRSSTRRISSSFTQARFHPILRRRVPHPASTTPRPPARRSGRWPTGRVTHAAGSAGYGKLVKIRHATATSRGTRTCRGFANLALGQKVRQKQVIGYVGSSGLSTGPHVCTSCSRRAAAT
jgi:murein DD-endopeptidase MepM/ murein hydrolase activator NlpD